jgi:hypothetical protein
MDQNRAAVVYEKLAAFGYIQVLLIWRMGKDESIPVPKIINTDFIFYISDAFEM